MRVTIYTIVMLIALLASTNVILATSTLSISSITPATKTIDAGTTVTLTATWTGGTSPYSITWYTGPSGTTCPQETANVLATYSSLTGTSNSLSVSPTSSNSYCIGVTDSESPTVTRFSLNYTQHNITSGISNFYTIPVGVAISPSGTYAYIINDNNAGGSGTPSNIVIMNTATNTVANVITSGLNVPQYVAFSPSGAYAYVTNYNSNNVIIINTSTNTVTGAITSGLNGPAGVAISPDGSYAYVTNDGSNNVAIINTATNTVTGTITSGVKNPSDLSFSPDGSYAYVTNDGSNNVAIINTATNTITGAITSGFKEPSGVAFFPSGAYAYVTNYGSNNVVVVTTATNTVTGAITSGFRFSQSVAISPSGNFAYITNANNPNTNITVMNPGVDTEITNLIYSNVISNTALAATAVSPSGNVVIDSGQGVLFYVPAPTTGTSPYKYHWYSGNSATCTSDSAISGATNQSEYLSPSSNTYYCAKITDSALAPQTVYTSTTYVTVNSSLGIPSIAPSNPTIDNGQSITISSSWTGGTPTYGASLYSSSTSTCNQQSTLVEQIIGISANTVTFSPIYPNANTNYCIYLTDNAVYSYSLSKRITGGVSYPYGVAFSPSGTYAYVTNFYGPGFSLSSPNISIINTATNTVVKHITGGFYEPYSVSFAPSGSYAYVTNVASGNVVIINTSTNTVTGAITPGFSGPDGVAISPSGTYAYVTNYNSNNVAIINTATNTVINSITSGFNEPHSIAFAPSGSYAYVVNDGSNNVVIINTATNTVTGAITSGFNESYGIAFSPTGAYAYVANYYYLHSNVVIINTATNTVMASTNLTSAINLPEGLSISPSGTYAYIAMGSSSVVVMDTGASITNSINTKVTMSSALTASLITPSSPSINLGQSVTLAANPSGGTSPYTYNWYTIAGTTAPTCTTANQITGQNVNSITVSPTATNTYSYQTVDSASVNGIACSTGDTVTVVQSGTQVSNPYKGGPTGFFGNLPGATTATSSSTTTVSTTLSTISAPITLPVIIPRSTTVQLCGDAKGYNVNYSSIDVLFHISSGTSSCFNVTAENETSKYYALNSSVIKAINYSIDNGNASSNITLSYPCSINYSDIYPAILRNNTWKEINPFAINAATCTVTFAVPSDPVIALFNTNANIISTTISTTSVSTVPVNSALQSNQNTIWIVAILVIIVIVISAIYFARKRR